MTNIFPINKGRIIGFFCIFAQKLLILRFKCKFFKFSSFMDKNINYNEDENKI